MDSFCCSYLQLFANPNALFVLNESEVNGLVPVPNVPRGSLAMKVVPSPGSILKSFDPKKISLPVNWRSKIESIIEDRLFFFISIDMHLVILLSDKQWRHKNIFCGGYWSSKVHIYMGGGQKMKVYWKWLIVVIFLFWPGTGKNLWLLSPMYPPCATTANESNFCRVKKWLEGK